MPLSAQLTLFAVGAASFAFAVKRDFKNTSVPDRDGPTWLSGFCMGIAVSAWGALFWSKMLAL
jgi:hypothetical protein